MGIPQRRSGKVGQNKRLARCVCAFYIGAQFFGLLSGNTKSVHCCAQLCLGLAHLVCHLGFALLQIGDRLIAGFLCFVQGLGHFIQFANFGFRHACEPVHQPVCEPSQNEGNKKDKRNVDGKLGFIQRFFLFARRVFCRFGFYLFKCCRLFRRSFRHNQAKLNTSVCFAAFFGSVVCNRVIFSEPD